MRLSFCMLKKTCALQPNKIGVEVRAEVLLLLLLIFRNHCPSKRCGLEKEDFLRAFRNVIFPKEGQFRGIF